MTVVGAALLLALFTAQPAAAQATETSPARGTILDPTTVGLFSDMDFGDISTTGVNGTVTLTPAASAVCTTTGGLVRTGTCRAARFDGDATFLAELRVQRPTPPFIDLVGPMGATMRVDNWTMGSTFPTQYLGASGANHRFRIWNLLGNYTFYVGGRLNVAGNQRPGHYTGTFQVNVTYN